MKLSEKLLTLRKQHNLSQEELAEKLNVSRQAIYRWESDQSLPDTANIIQLTKLYHVSADYLLNDEYDYEEDMPIVKYAADHAANHSLMEMSYILSIGLGIISAVIGLTGIFIAKSTLLTVISIVLSVITVALFEASLVKYGKGGKNTYRRRFYDIAVWTLLFIPACIVYNMSVYLVWSFLNGKFSYATFHSPSIIIINLIYFLLVYLIMVFVARYLIRKR